MANLKREGVNEYNREALLAAVGGDLKGKDFRAAKRASKKINRTNKRHAKYNQIVARNKRKGKSTLRNKPKGQWTAAKTEQQKVNNYFKDLQEGRNKKAGAIAGVVAATVLTAGAAGALLKN